MKRIKKALSFILVLCMVFTMVPGIALAEDTVPNTNEPVVEQVMDENVSDISEENDEALIDLMSLEEEDAIALAASDTKPADGTVSGSNPFPSSVSSSYRGPATVVLNDGTIVVAGNILWNTTYDGGGLDTIVSRSTDGGKTWNYTVPNYFGDNGNQYNVNSASFIDPALATDGSTIYMLVDIQAYGVSLNGASGFTTPATSTGFNSNGKLLLKKDGESAYNYYLDGTTIKYSNGTAVSGYTVDAEFNITGNGVNTNLFLEDSPYKVTRTMYLYLKKSTDGGKTWTDPVLIPNVKTSSEMACLAAPSAGLVTSNGTIIFPCYSYNGSTESQKMSFLSSTDGGKNWTRSASMTGASWSSESSVVELKDGTLRFFFRNGTAKLYYVDYVNGSWKTPVNTGIAVNSNTQVASTKLSKTSDGKEVIVVSCPKGYGNNGSTSSSQNDRGCGRLFVGLVNTDGTMDFNTISPIEVNNSMYLYSAVNELPSVSRAATEDVNLFVTYEDTMNGWGTGYSASVTTTIKTVSLANTNTDDEDTDVTVPEDSNDNVADTKNVTLKVGESAEYTDETGNYEGSYTGAGLDTSIATVVVKGKTKEGTPAVPASTNKIASPSSGEYIIGNGTQWITVNGSTIGYTTDAAQATKFTVTKSNTSYTIKTGNYYLRPRSSNNNYSLNLNTSSSYSAWNVNNNGNLYYSNRYLRWSGYVWQVNNTNSNNGALYTYTPGTDAVLGEDYSTITITGVKPGQTSVVVGSTKYNITVEKGVKNISVSVGGQVTVTDSAASTAKSSNTTIATVSASGNNLTIKGVKEGTIVVNTDTTTYNVTVNDGTAMTIKAGEMNTLSVDLADGQYVEWSSADSSYVAVAGKYNGTSYTNEAMLQGQKETTSPVAVVATIKNADGSVAGTQKWLVTVTPADTKTGNTKYLYLNIEKIEHCTVYYSINAGELIKVNGTGVLLDERIDQNVRIDVFAAPDEGYALTYMAASNSAGQYYSLDNGTRPDGADSDGWPLADANQSTIPSNGSSSEWKTVNGSLHGSRWGLLEGNYTVDQLRLLYAQAIALGCDGVTGFTKNNAGTATDNASNGNNLHTNMTFVAQKLPTVEKEIVSIIHDGKTTNYTEGAKVAIGDTINYKVTVTRYATDANYGTITYSNEKLSDALTNNSGISNPSMGTSTTADKTYTYNTSLNLTMANFANVVKDGEIINTVDFSYSYKGGYSSGTAKASDIAEASVTVEIPEYVIDFGNPIEIDLSKDLGNTTISNGTATYGTVSANGTKLTYQPTKVLEGIEYISLTLANGQSYGVRIYPATTVNYAEGFATLSGFDGGVKGTVNQTTQIAGQSADVYGYDANVAGESNAVATSTVAASNATFNFTGTGVDIYNKATADSGKLSIIVRDAETNTIKKMVIVNTKSYSTITDDYSNTAQDGLVAASITGLDYGKYTVKVTATTADPSYFDGFRVYGTLENQKNAVYTADKEDDPTFLNVRDYVLTSMNVENQDSASVYSQVREATDGQLTGVVLSNDNAYDGQALLENGPKNELFLLPGQQVVFVINTNRVVQVGLKAINGEIEVSDSYNGTISTSTDMFYKVASKATTATTKTITIKNNSATGILSVTKVKVCDDPNVTFGELTEEDISAAVEALNAPAPVPADASLKINLVDYKGAVMATTGLTANGVIGETATFTADEIKDAVTAALPAKYGVDESSIKAAQVAYGEAGTVKVVVGKVATLKINYKKGSKVVGTATLTAVQTSSASKHMFSTSDIKNACPAGYSVISLVGTSVGYGATKTINGTCK